MTELSTARTTLVNKKTESTRLVVECVLFDLDGTLYSSQEYNARVEDEIVGIVAQDLQINMSLAKRRLGEERRKQGTLTGALRVLGVDRGLFFEALADRVEPLEYLEQDASTISTICGLKQRGFKLGLVTNNGRIMVRKILNAIGLEASRFDTIVTSEDCEPKPSSQPFLYALSKLNCSPAQAVYIGDRVEPELLPARKLGIPTILLARNGNMHQGEVDLVVTHLQEILALLE